MRMSTSLLLAATAVTLGLLGSTVALADPCGMVPPLYQGQGAPITRIGEQQTYVFYKDGVESFVIRPGFAGKVDEFGMLIPFPTPPAVRKVPDHIFAHVAAAIDPPEVVIDLRPRPQAAMARGFSNAGKVSRDSESLDELRREEVRVVRVEAVGMYEVAVLQAGSAAALNKWMVQHGYRYPEGMDKVCEEYITERWCFVAVKTKVGSKDKVDARPGQRRVQNGLPSGSTFDGFVQGMGFRFRTDELVVPMRLSAFNDGELRNIVYLMTDAPKKIRSIPEEYVVRQITGEQLFGNVTNPLPLRIIGGTEADLGDWHRRNLKERRNPVPKNGAAKELFASDLQAVTLGGELILPHEQSEKELLRIGERLGLRGDAVDRLNAKVLNESTAKTVTAALDGLKEMTLTMVDGDFPREVLAGQNLTFAEYKMPQRRNNSSVYNATKRGPSQRREGTLILGDFSPHSSENQVAARGWVFALPVMAMAIAGLVWIRRSRVAATLVLAALLAGSSVANAADLKSSLADLEDAKKAGEAVDALVKLAGDKENRKEVVSSLLAIAEKGDEISARGWAITALAEIGGEGIDESLLKIHADGNQDMLVRTWAAAGRVTMTQTTEGLIEKADLINQFPALGRPIGMRIVGALKSGSDQPSAEGLLEVSLKIPKLQQALGPAILAQGAENLCVALTTAKDQNVRRQAAGYLGALAGQGGETGVPQAVVAAYKFDAEAKDVPWTGGPLFLPGIQWSKEHAQALVQNLIAWNLYCDRNGKGEGKKQLHNNLRSLGLARAAGYQSPGWNEANTQAWLKAWGKVIGKEKLAAMLEEQGVEDDKKYANVLDGLK